MTKHMILVLLVLLAFSFPVSAHEGETHAPDTAHVEAGTKPLSLEASMAALTTAIEAENLAPVHELTEQAMAGTTRLIAEQQLTGDPATRLEAAGRQFTAQLANLHAASDKKDLAATKAEFAKAKSAYLLLKARLLKQGTAKEQENQAVEGTSR